jgi:hypothetical protein
MSWKNGLKEMVVDAARRLIDDLPTATRFAAYGPIVLEAAGLTKLAQSIAGSTSGLYLLGGAVGAALLGIGVLLRFLPGTSADLRQTAMKMVEGGIITLAIIGTGALILEGAHWIGRELATSFKATGGAGELPTDYINPWKK